MGNTKQKLKNGEPALGGWIMIGHPTIGELMAGEDFDFITVDLEHTPIGYQMFQNIATAVNPSGKDLLVRLQENDLVMAKRCLDAGANGIIVPVVNNAELARSAVAMCKFPPAGIRGAAFSRASDYGRNFRPYFDQHNDNSLVVVMLEHIEAANNVDEILSTPGIDATLIGPYDLSASMGRPGELDHPEVEAAVQKILDGCKRHNVPAGVHIVQLAPDMVRQRIEEGFRFIACSLDTEMIMAASRMMLQGGGR